MSEKVRIALDVMGGDHGPPVILPGAELALARRPGTEFILFGDGPTIEQWLASHPALRASSRVSHTDVAIRMDEKPSQALRRGRYKSSMWLAIEAVKKGEADVAVSAGNTGALMAMATFNLRTIGSVQRPAIAAIWPTLRGESIVLDVGASIGADALHLVNLALMGSAMARILFSLEKPTVGLLNVGVEEVKGLEEVRNAGQMLREGNFPGLDYTGFVEGDGIGKGVADVVVTEGFAGNIALKAAEGTARQIGGYLKAEMSRTLSAKIGYLFARGAFRALARKMDPGRSNGGVFLGLNGIVIKSHGGTDARGFASAIEIGYEMAHSRLLNKIRSAIARDTQQAAAEASS